LRWSWPVVLERSLKDVTDKVGDKSPKVNRRTELHAGRYTVRDTARDIRQLLGELAPWSEEWTIKAKETLKE